jgi:pimeloyl-ACP methyl ester carboxylesterase
MLRYLAVAAATVVLATPVVARVMPFPAAFHTQMVNTNGTRLYVRVAGHGPAVVMLHGFADTGDMWAPLAIVLMKDHTVIVPDSGHWIMEENPQATIKLVTEFLAK